MRKVLAGVLASLLLTAGCGASGSESVSQAETSAPTTANITTTSERPTTTAATTTTTTMPASQAMLEMTNEVSRACEEAARAARDPQVQYNPGWEPYFSETELTQRAERCMDAKFAALEEAERQEEQARQEAEAAAAAKAEAAAAAEAAVTVGQRNARQSASDYLDYTSFSRTGLIGQLKYEGYSEADATYAVDALNVDWNEQAAKKAAEYLDYSSFSRSGLLDQLIYEGFTQAQAEYGVSTTGY